MRLTIVLALLCFCHTVLCAPAVNPKHATKEDKTAKDIPSDTLELQLQGVPIDQPIHSHHEDEDESEPITELVGANNNGGPEVKRSERVNTEDGAEIDLHDLSGNLKAADQDVKAVLRTFFQNLKQHPEIVEDIIEREGAKLMERPLEEGTGNTVPVDISDFQQPSPQLRESPKQVEKKTGAFPEYPRFIYKSPMRNMKERNKMTSRSQNNQQQPSHQNEAPEHNTLVDNGSDVKAPQFDLSNAIPVIQQPSTNQETEEEKVNELLSNPAEGGAIDLAALQKAQDEFSHAHPAINTLPLFPDHPKYKIPQKLVEPEHKTKMEPEESEESAEEKGTEDLDSMIVYPHADSEETVDSDIEEAEPDEKRAEKPAELHLESHEEKESPEVEGSWSETQANEPSQETVPHQLTGSEIAAETLNNPVESESSVTFRPYAYYYYYNGDGDKGKEGEMDVPEEEGETEASNEEQLVKISSEADDSDEEEEEETKLKKEADDSKDADDEIIEDEEHDEDAEEDEVDEEDDEEDDNEAHADDLEEDEGVEEGDEEANIDAEEEKEADESQDEVTELDQDQKSDESKTDDKTNSENVHVEETVIIPDFDKNRIFKTKGTMLDKNEADLMSLDGNDRPRTANRPIAGPPM